MKLNSRFKKGLKKCTALIAAVIMTVSIFMPSVSLIADDYTAPTINDGDVVARDVSCTGGTDAYISGSGTRTRMYTINWSSNPSEGSAVSAVCGVSNNKSPVGGSGTVVKIYDSTAGISLRTHYLNNGGAQIEFGGTWYSSLDILKAAVTYLKAVQDAGSVESLAGGAYTFMIFHSLISKIVSTQPYDYTLPEDVVPVVKAAINQYVAQSGGVTQLYIWFPDNKKQQTLLLGSSVPATASIDLTYKIHKVVRSKDGASFVNVPNCVFAFAKGSSATDSDMTQARNAYAKLATMISAVYRSANPQLRATPDQINHHVMNIINAYNSSPSSGLNYASRYVADVYASLLQTNVNHNLTAAQANSLGSAILGRTWTDGSATTILSIVNTTFKSAEVQNALNLSNIKNKGIQFMFTNSSGIAVTDPFKVKTYTVPSSNPEVATQRYRYTEVMTHDSTIPVDTQVYYVNARFAQAAITKTSDVGYGTYSYSIQNQSGATIDSSGNIVFNASTNSGMKVGDYEATLVNNSGTNTIKNTTNDGKFIDSKDYPLYYNAQLSFTILKTTEKGNQAKGATFTVYSDAACTTSVGTMTYSSADNGRYTFSRTPAQLGWQNKEGNDDNTYKKTFYIKETTGANQEKVNGAWVTLPSRAKVDPNIYKAVFTWIPKNGYMTAQYYRGVNSNTGLLNPEQTGGRTSNTDGAVSNIAADFTTLPFVNTPSVTANAAFRIDKRSDENLPMTGAKFTVYSNAAMTNVASGVTMTAGTTDTTKNLYSSSVISFAATDRSSTTVQTKEYWVKETSAATSERIAANNWKTVTSKLDATAYHVVITWNPSTGALTEKIYKWVNGANSGDPIVSRSNSRAANVFVTEITAGQASFTHGNGVNVSATVGLNLNKVAVIGSDATAYPARGAEFKIFSDAACTTEVGSLTDNEDGSYIYNFNTSVFGTQQRSTNRNITKNFYMKETATATQYLKGGSWQDVPASCNPNNTVYQIKLTWNPHTGAITAVLSDGDTVLDSQSGTRNVGVYTSTVAFAGTITNRSPEIKTTLYDKELGIDEDTARSGKNVEIIDKVEYSNLETDVEYTLTGTLMVKETGDALTDAEGNEITATVPFTPSQSDDSIEMSFSVDTTLCEGQTLVAYQTLKKGDTVLIEANDINDVNETVYVPGGKTTATDEDTEAHVGRVDKTVTIIDCFEYENLIIGQEYTISGVLVDRATGESLIDAEGNEIRSSVAFTAETKNGTIDVPFTFDSSLLAGKSVCVFEDLYKEDINILAHHKLVDEQTVDYPDIGTLLLNDKVNEHVTGEDEELELTDTVMYSNLTPGIEYTMHAAIMVKETGEALLDKDGNPVVGEASFTPDEKDGTVDVKFNFTINADELKGKTLICYESLDLIKDDGTTVVINTHNDLSSVDQSVNVFDLKTTFFDVVFEQTADKTARQASSVDLVDIVHYENLFPGKEYTLTGTIMVKETGEALKDKDGKEITSSVKFTPEEATGDVRVVFEGIDTTTVAGKKLVAFETIKYGDVTLFTHADLEDEEQTVDVPDIKTTFYDKALGSEEDTARAGDTVELVDTVKYTNLEAGKEYKLTGTIMVKETGEALLDKDGKPVVAETTFTPSTPSGTVDMVFTIDTSAVKGQKLVAFETLSLRGIDVVVHADIDDNEQTVDIPDIKTTLKDKTTDDHISAVAEKVTLVDTVSYKNLIPGKEYTMKAVLMYKNGDKVLDKDGKEITSSVKFTPTSKEGTVEVVFADINTSHLRGKTIVCFETVMYKDVELAIHADLDDKEQTVYFPKIGTLASVGGKKTFTPAESITLVDKVMYTNLVPGRTYELHGKVMKKATGEQLMSNGQPVEAVLKFTPEASEGVVSLSFTFNGKDLKKGDQLVVFETLYICDDNDTSKTTKIDTHEDLTDTDQTVTVEEIPNTGDTTSAYDYLCGAGISLTFILLAVVLFSKKERKTGNVI